MEGIWAQGDSTNRFALAGLDHHAWILRLGRKEESLFKDIDFTSMHDVSGRVTDVTDARYSSAIARIVSSGDRTEYSG